MSALKPEIEDSWRLALEDDFSSPYFNELKKFLQDEKKNYTIYPSGSDIFSAFNRTPLPSVKVVILGQDPYHGPGSGAWVKFFRSKGS